MKIVRLLNFHKYSPPSQEIVQKTNDESLLLSGDQRKRVLSHVNVQQSTPHVCKKKKILGEKYEKCLDRIHTIIHYTTPKEDIIL